MSTLSNDLTALACGHPLPRLGEPEAVAAVIHRLADLLNELQRAEHPNAKAPAQDVALARLLYEFDLSIAAIARQLGYAESTVRDWVRGYSRARLAS